MPTPGVVPPVGMSGCGGGGTTEDDADGGEGDGSAVVDTELEVD